MFSFEVFSHIVRLDSPSSSNGSQSIGPRYLHDDVVIYTYTSVHRTASLDVINNLPANRGVNMDVVKKEEKENCTAAALLRLLDAVIG